MPRACCCCCRVLTSEFNADESPLFYSSLPLSPSHGRWITITHIRNDNRNGKNNVFFSLSRRTQCVSPEKCSQSRSGIQFWARDSDAVVIITATLSPSPFQQSLLIFYVRAFPRKLDCSYSAVHTSANVLQVSDFVVSTSDDSVDWYFRHVALLPESVMHKKERENSAIIAWYLANVDDLFAQTENRWRMYVRWLFINCKLLCLFFHLEQNGKYFHFAHKPQSFWRIQQHTFPFTPDSILVFVSRLESRWKDLISVCGTWHGLYFRVMESEWELNIMKNQMRCGLIQIKILKCEQTQKLFVLCLDFISLTQQPLEHNTPNARCSQWQPFGRRREMRNFGSDKHEQQKQKNVFNEMIKCGGR